VDGFESILCPGLETAVLSHPCGLTGVAISLAGRDFRQVLRDLCEGGLRAFILPNSRYRRVEAVQIEFRFAAERPSSRVFPTPPSTAGFF
jgi:hypothetical protein